MTSRLKRLLKNEGGITALETAIILIAFVVVAAVFAFTALSAGMFSTERGKEAIYAGISEVTGSVELKGSVIATGITATDTISGVIFSLANVAGGEPIDFTTGDDAVVIVEYRDSDQRVAITNWSASFLGYTDDDDLLEARELVEVTVPITGNVTTGLGANKTFALEVKPPQGGTLVLERTTPSVIDAVMDLH